MLKFVIMFSLFLSLPVMAKRIELSKIYNDIDNEVVTFYLHLDQNEKIDSMSYVTKSAQGAVVKEKDWIYSEVANGGGVLDVRNGYDILKLQLAESFNRNNGGIISLNYLFNGATGSRKFLNFEVKKVLGQYKLLHTDKLVKTLHIKSNSVPVIGLVGIRLIQVTFAQ